MLSSILIGDLRARVFHPLMVNDLPCNSTESPIERWPRPCRLACIPHAWDSFVIALPPVPTVFALTLKVTSLAVNLALPAVIVIPYSLDTLARAASIDCLRALIVGLSKFEIFIMSESKPNDIAPSSGKILN